MEGKTAADILREMRAWTADDHYDPCEVSLNVSAFADRLEAAIRREKATTEKSSAVGNAARMREAIVHMIDTADSIAMREPAGAIGKLAFHIKHTGDAALAAPPSEPVTDCNQSNAARMREALVGLTDKVLDYLHNGLIQLPLPIEEANAKARSALAAPPRNCDVYTTTDEARWAYHMHGNGLATMQAFCDWFLAPAKESGVAK